MKKKTILLIDGENFKRKIVSVFKGANKPKPTWHTYDWQGLFNQVLSDIEIEQKIFTSWLKRKYLSTIEKVRIISHKN